MARCFPQAAVERHLNCDYAVAIFILAPIRGMAPLEVRNSGNHMVSHKVDPLGLVVCAQFGALLNNLCIICQDAFQGALVMMGKEFVNHCLALVLHQASV